MFMNGKLNNIKMSILFKLIYKLNVIPTKVPAGFLVNLDRLTLKNIYGNIKGLE